MGIADRLYRLERASRTDPRMTAAEIDAAVDAYAARLDRSRAPFVSPEDFRNIVAKAHVGIQRAVATFDSEGFFL